MRILWLDLETASKADIKRVGAWRYASDPSTWVRTIACAWDDEPVETVDSNELERRVRQADVIRSHNAAFERDILDRVLMIDTPVELWEDTAAFAAACGLPRKLETLCVVLKLGRDAAKDKRGKRLIKLLSEPMSDGTFRRDPALEAEFAEYCRQDVEAMRACWQRLPDKVLTPTERRIMQVDMRINERGVATDRALAIAARDQYAALVAGADDALADLTDGAVPSVSEVANLRAWLAERGCNLPDLRADTVDKAAEDPRYRPECRQALQLRQIGAKTGGAKFERFVELTDIDGRAHDLHMYYAAHTGRWGGRMLQPQNMPRPTIKDTDTAAEIVKAGELDMFYPEPMPVLNSVVRSCIVPSPGHRLYVGDYSQIEARIVPWLAGQEDVLQVFRTHGKIYEAAAAGIFRVPIEEVTKDQRMVGKVAILALGFGGGSAAFESMARQYRVPVPDNVEQIVKAWRKSNKRIVSLWYDVERAFRQLLSPDHDGSSLRVGKHLRMYLRGRTICVRLPNDFIVRYHHTHIDDMDRIAYLGVHPKTFNWSVIDTWGGKIVQNLTEAVGRCLLGEALIDMEDTGMQPVLHIHDEAVADAPPDKTLDEFRACMERPRAWAQGLPVAADCHALTRYRKM